MFSFDFSGEETLRTYPGRQPRGFKEAGKETGKTTGWIPFFCHRLNPEGFKGIVQSKLTPIQMEALVTFSISHDHFGVSQREKIKCPED